MIEQQYNHAKSLLAARLYAPYQQEGVLWMLTMENNEGRPKGGFLCDEMGLGKTVQLIATMLGNKKKRTLVVVPKSIVSQWVNEVRKFAPSLTCKEWDRDVNADVIVVPYSMVGKVEPIKWDRIILDEAHEIRNRSSKIFRTVCSIKADIRWVVTGTPVFNSISDFVSLCQFIGISKALVQGMTNKVKDIYILRRTKEDRALPSCYFDNIELNMYKEERQLYDFVFKDAQDTIKEIFKTSVNLNAKNMQLLECLLRARQCCIWPQMYYDGVCRRTGRMGCSIQENGNSFGVWFTLTPNEKSLIFCQFIE
jgi:SNF2 family DNA or RNA helicase